MCKRFKFQPMMPCSLHDMTVNKIECVDSMICFRFVDEWSKQEDILEGSIVIEGVDFDYANILLLNKDGEYGKFAGHKLYLKEFIEKYKNFKFEIIDEKYGYNTTQYNGYVYLGTEDDCSEVLEMIISIYHFGDIVYNIRNEL